MTAQTKAILKGYFNTGDQPVEANFSSLIDTIGQPGLVVAASNSSDASIGRSDYVCDGADDEVQIQAAIDALPATGGAIWLTEGTFNLDTAGVDIDRVGVNIRGLSKNGTKVFVNGAFDGFTVNSGTDSLASYFHLSDFWMVLPAAIASNGIVLVRDRSNCGNIERLRFSGGNAGAWAIRADGSCVATLSDITGWPINCNGILWQNSPAPVSAINYGEVLIIGSDIYLGANDLTALKIAGPDDSAKMINDILVARCAFDGNGPANGCVGVHIRNSSRITLLNVDIENAETGLLQESGQGGGSNNYNNGFINVFALGCGTDYVETGTVYQQAILGGDGDFVNLQKLPTGLILSAPDASKHRVIVANDGTLSTEVVA